jgi:hypothetical protein
MMLWGQPSKQFHKNKAASGEGVTVDFILYNFLLSYVTAYEDQATIKKLASLSFTSLD